MESAEKRIHQVILLGHGWGEVLPVLTSSRVNPLLQERELRPGVGFFVQHPRRSSAAIRRRSGFTRERARTGNITFGYFLCLANAASSA